MVTKHHPTPEERDERVSVPLAPAEFIEGVLAVEPDDSAHDYDVHNWATKHSRVVHGSLADAHRAVNELVKPGQQWTVIQMPLGGTGTGKTISEGVGPIAD